PHLFGEPDAIVHRHHHVAQNDRGRLAIHRVDGVVGVAGFLRLISPSCQPAHEEFPDRLFVIDDKNVWHRPRLPIIARPRIGRYPGYADKWTMIFEGKTMKSLGFI